jgi:hypothetical protein
MLAWLVEETTESSFLARPLLLLLLLVPLQ